MVDNVKVKVSFKKYRKSQLVVCKHTSVLIGSPLSGVTEK